MRLIAVELYRVIPKRIKEEKSVDALVSDPDKFVAEKKRAGRTVKLPDIDLLEDETGWFIDDVREGYYFWPEPGGTQRPARKMAVHGEKNLQRLGYGGCQRRKPGYGAGIS